MHVTPSPKRLALAAACLLSASNADPLTLLQRQASECPGYTATNIVNDGSSITADLNLAGPACNKYGSDLSSLKLQVEYQTSKRLHVQIFDQAQQVYQIPESVLTRPQNGKAPENTSDLQFLWIESPFSFAVTRRGSGETMFNTSGSPLIFESQYLNLRTQLPQNPNLYGLGETTDDMRLGTTNYTRTLWSRDAPNTPQHSNLYGNHPVYYDHRANGTHGVFLMNSNGMDIKINQSSSGQYLEYNTLGGIVDLYFLAGPEPKDVAIQYAEVVGKPAMMPYFGFGFHNCRYGYQDLYEVAETIANYSNAGIPLETQWTDIDYMDRRKIFSADPYRYNLSLFRELVDTLHKNDQHYVVMVDPAVAYQNYAPFTNGVAKDAFLKIGNGSTYRGVVWPGVTAFPDWFAPNAQDYWSGEFDAFFNAESGVDIDALWIDMNEASNFIDWESPSNCGYDCENIEVYANASSNPPRRIPARIGAPRPIPGFGPNFQPKCHSHISFNFVAQNGPNEGILVLGNTITLGDGRIDYAPPVIHLADGSWNLEADVPANTSISYQYVRVVNETLFEYEATTRNITTGGCGSSKSVDDTITTPPVPQQKRSIRNLRSADSVSHAVAARRDTGSKLGLPGRDLLNPAYAIGNTYGPALSARTLQTDLIQSNGAAVYDTHNTYGSMMSLASRNAMLSRRPDSRPLVITRSTFAGAGAHVGHWTGDNAATWDHYRWAIQQIQEFTSLFQVPMVGSDICGFNPPDTTDTLCARWAFVGAFSPFFRDHSADNVNPHPLYYSEFVAAAARTAIEVRYRLLDYAYSAFWKQTETGGPWILPMFFVYPNDTNTVSLQWQFFYGDSLLVAPVTQENSTEVTFYLPEDQFYDFWTFESVLGEGKNITLPNVGYDTVPLYIKAGSIVPIRVESANTTKALRTKNFDLIVAPKRHSTVVSTGSLYLDDGDSINQTATSEIDFTYGDGLFNMSGTFDYDPGNVVIENIILLGSGGAGKGGSFNATNNATTYKVNASLRQPLSQQLT